MSGVWLGRAWYLNSHDHKGNRTHLTSLVACRPLSRPLDPMWRGPPSQVVGVVGRHPVTCGGPPPGYVRWAATRLRAVGRHPVTCGGPPPGCVRWAATRLHVVGRHPIACGGPPPGYTRRASTRLCTVGRHPLTRGRPPLGYVRWAATRLRAAGCHLAMHGDFHPVAAGLVAGVSEPS